MQVFLQIVAFSLKTDESGRPVLTKRKAPSISEILGAQLGMTSVGFHQKTATPEVGIAVLYTCYSSSSLNCVVTVYGILCIVCLYV